MTSCLPILTTFLALAASCCGATPQRVVPSEWQSTITVTINSTVVLQGKTLKSAGQQAVLISNQINGDSMLWRTDLLSVFHIQNSTCERTQLYNSEILLLLDFLLAPGTVYQSTMTIKDRRCDVWVSPFAPNTPWGKYVCLEASTALSYQRPVRYWLTLPALDYVVEFENDFKAAGVIPHNMLAVPSNCPQPDITQPLPLGLADPFEEGHVKTFWMPPLKKYYTYEPGHIVVKQGPARVGTHAAHVTVQPGDVRNTGTERDELDMPMLRLGGRELYYSWSFMLDADFGFSSNRVVLGQWKQSSLFTQSPVVALRLKEKKLVLSVRNVTLELVDDDRVYYDLVEEMKLGKWYDVECGFLFSHEGDGFVKVWIDGKDTAVFQGPTMSKADQGYFDFHFGVYRDQTNITQTLLLDHFRVSGNKSKSVTLV